MSAQKPADAAAAAQQAATHSLIKTAAYMVHALSQQQRINTLSTQAFNFFASVFVITVNKTVFKYYGFNFSTLLTSWHFICTYLGLLVCNFFGMFEIKQVCDWGAAQLAHQCVLRNTGARERRAASIAVVRRFRRVQQSESAIQQRWLLSTDEGRSPLAGVVEPFCAPRS